MNPRRHFTLAILFSLAGFAALFAADAKVDPAVPPLKFNDVEFLHRWSEGDQHEFTPRGQEDLEKWKEMITLHYYRVVKDGDGLAAAANSILESYKKSGGAVIKTGSVPRTPEKPAEYLMVVAFTRSGSIEVVFARFVLTGGVGSAVIFSHREYGPTAGDQANAWLQKNGPILDPALMSWTGMPAMDSLKK